MTDGQPEPTGGGGTADPDADVLDALKDGEPSADDTDVLDGIGGRPRMTWNSVTDAGGAPPEAPTADSGFEFDLGGALARFAGGASETGSTESEPVEARTDDAAGAQRDAGPIVAPEPLPSRAEPVVAEPAAREPAPEPAAASEPLPMRGESVVDESVAEPAVEPLPMRGESAVGQSVPESTVAAEPLPTRDERRRTDPAPTEPIEPVADYPRRVPGAHLESQMRATEDVVPPIREATSVDDPVARPRATQSVFDVGQTGGVSGAPSLPGGPNSAAAGGVPTLPASNPAAPPSVVEPIGSAPSTPEIAQLRSAQLKASRQQRKGKLFGRSLLAFVLIGGLTAAALVFGRSLLFETEWDAQLTPIVNDVEAARGAEFDSTVPLVVVPASELGDRLRTATIGDAWVERVPQWRALGLATGSVDADTVGSALVEANAAFYDPTDDQIYLADGVEPDAAAPDLRVALERAFDAQQGAQDADADAAELGTATGFVGVSSLDSIATRAVDTVIASGGSVAGRQPANEALPFPIAYELASIEVLGEPLLAAAGVEPTQLDLGGPYPDGLGALLDDDPRTTTSGLIEPGEVSITPPMALGTDDWSLVWGARLPETTVDRLVTQVTADSYRPIDRNGAVCFVAVFQTSNEPDGNSVFASLLTWAANAPAASQATATQLGPTRVQLEACDPGADGGVAPNIGVVDSLIDRQQLRLTN